MRTTDSNAPPPIRNPNNEPKIIPRERQKDSCKNFTRNLTSYNSGPLPLYPDNPGVTLGQLRYQGSIRAYMTEFKALNYFARATGESLREKVDLAMNDAILDMQFNQNPNDLVDDKQFLHATYRAEIQVEKKKALKGAREAVKAGAPQAPKVGQNRGNPERQKDGQSQDGADSTRKGKGTKGETREREKGESWYGRETSWATKEAALKGVPATEREKYGKSREDCGRCGRRGHKTYECFSYNTMKGTALPKAPWKASAVGQGKRKRPEEIKERPPPAKLQKIAAVETMNTNTATPLWEDSESDF